MLILFYRKIKQCRELQDTMSVMFWRETLKLDLGKNKVICISFNMRNKTKERYGYDTHVNILQEAFKLAGYGESHFDQESLRKHLENIGYYNVLFIKG